MNNDQIISVLIFFILDNFEIKYENCVNLCNTFADSSIFESY